MIINIAGVEFDPAYSEAARVLLTCEEAWLLMNDDERDAFDQDIHKFITNVWQQTQLNL